MESNSDYVNNILNKKIEILNNFIKDKNNLDIELQSFDFSKINDIMSEKDNLTLSFNDQLKNKLDDESSIDEDLLSDKNSLYNDYTSVSDNENESDSDIETIKSDI